jgi:hypothetical protein
VASERQKMNDVEEATVPQNAVGPIWRLDDRAGACGRHQVVNPEP